MAKRTFFSIVALLLGIAVLGATGARAQTGTIEGQVVNADDGSVIPGANVALPDLGTGTATNADGRYTIEDVPAGEHSVEASFVGYESQERVVEVPAGETVSVNFELASSALDLGEVVVTGAGVTTEKKRLGQSVSTVDAADLETAPVTSVEEALQGRIPGMVANSLGEVGASAPIRLRGTVSLTQRNGPLIYVDGVRIGGGQESFASVTTSALSQINPENIKSIEVLKGAAAATLYGTEASSGVIQITTKKGIGTLGQRWTFKVTQGMSQTPVDRIPPNASYDSESGNILRNSPAGQFIDLGHKQEYNLSVSGGTDTYGYFASGWYRAVDGSLPTNGLENLGARLNLTARPLDGMEVRLGLNALNNQNRVPYPSWGLMGEFVLANPGGVTESRPFGELFHTIPGVLAYDNNKATDRSTMNAEVNYQWSDELQSHFLVGHHRANERAVIYVPPGVDQDANPTGLRQVTDEQHSETTLELNTAWETQLGDNLTSTLTAGAQGFWEQQRSNVSGVEDFSVSALETLRGGSTVFEVDEFYQEVVNAGVFAQEQIGLNDRLFLTGGLRMDGNSTFGENLGFQPYPQAGLSWVISDEPFWGLEVLDTFRLRAAYGTSGLQPGVYDALRTWQVQALLQNQPVLLPQSFGNPDLKPERSREIEVGGNAALLDQLEIDVTYYWQRTADAILARRRPPSSGFLAPQLVNIGELQGHGLEASADWTAVDNSGLRLDINGTFTTRTQTVTDLGGVSAFATSDDSRVWNFVQEGYSPGAVIAPVLNPENPYSLSVPASEFTDLNQMTPNFLQTDSGNRAREFIGHQLPTLTGSFGATVSLPQYNLRFSTLLRAEGGFAVFDETGLIRTTVGITPTVARMQQDLDDPSTSTERRREIAENYIQIHPQVSSNWVEDGDYLRLQNVAVTWDVPAKMAGALSVENASVTLAGRNLALFTGYDGIIDPGTTSSAENDLAANVDYFGAPSPRQVELSLRMTF